MNRSPSFARRASALAAAVLLGVSYAASARADDANDPQVVPYRPTVSTPAQLSAPGWLELEAGGLLANGPASGASRATLPYTLKLAFTPDWGVRIAGDAWVRDVEGSFQPAITGGGDTDLVLKHRIAISDANAWGLELGQKFPTAGSVLGSGHADTTLNGIFSSDFAPAWHADLNLNETRVGVPTGQSHPWQTGWAAAASRTLSDKWVAEGELSGTHQASTPNTAQALFAASYAASNAAAFDFGFALGLTKASPHNQVFAGMTVRLGRLF
jgi:hypothetical protein